MAVNSEPKVTLSRYTEKLTAFRQTLNNEERALLDAVVANSIIDVSAHGLAVESRASEGRTAGRLTDINAAIADMANADAALVDVEAHGLTAHERVSMKFTAEYGYQTQKVSDADSAVSDSAMTDAGIF